MTAAGAARVHELWRRVVTDELVYEAMVSGTHHAQAAALQLSEPELAALDHFRAQPGTVWAVQNIRFRGTSMTQRTLKGRLPCTLQMLTGGNNDWLWDLVYEYLAWCRWQDLGHERAAEALRFVDFVQRRVMQRRRFPELMETALQYESAVNTLLQRCAMLPPGAWPSDPEALAARIADARPALSPAACVLTLAHDVLDWLQGPTAAVSWFEARSGPPPADVVRAATPVALWMASPSARVTAERLTPEQDRVLAAARGERTGRELAAMHADAARWLGHWAAVGLVGSAPHGQDSP